MTVDEIKELRKELACTARELGAALGLGQADVLAWERGDSFPTKRHVEAMRQLREVGPSAIARAKRGAPASGMAALADPELWRLVRKLIAHPTLRAEVQRVAAGYDDPAE